MREKFLLFFIFLFLISCSQKGALKLSGEESPESLYVQGMEALESGDVDKADSLFDRALTLNKRCSSAYAGKALSTAMKARKEIAKGDQEVDWEVAHEDYIYDCEDTSVSESSRLICYIAAIRAYTEAESEDWLEDAETYYDDALDLDFEQIKDEELPFYKSKAAIHYYMARAYYRGGEREEAQEILEQTMPLMTGKWYNLSFELYQRVK
jgi:tetratricopeptide (TPR) repeat protein